MNAVVSRASAKAELRAIAHGVTQIMRIRRILGDLNISILP